MHNAIGDGWTVPLDSRVRLTFRGVWWKDLQVFCRGFPDAKMCGKGLAWGKKVADCAVVYGDYGHLQEW